ncbi:MAG: trehalase family glycosidase [Chloroflexota bacterium]
MEHTSPSVDIQSVSSAARRVLASNRRTGTTADGRRFSFVCPSTATYPFQWFWDSAFHAIALLHVDAELAKLEIRCLLQGAQPDGFIPHMLLWEQGFHDAAQAEYSIVLADPYYTTTIQPPVLARAIWRIYDATHDDVFLADVLPPTLRFFRWLKTYRDPDDDDLVAIIQPDESGLDASPKYDVLMQLAGVANADVLAALRVNMQRLFDAYAPFRADPAKLPGLDVFNWEDVLVNTIYADGLQAVGDLCRAAGYPVADGDEFARCARRVRSALGETCWDEHTGVFWDVDGNNQARARTLTVTSLLPLALDALDPIIARRLVENHLLNEREFWLPYPVPSVAATEPSFDPDHIARTTWRGPTWLNTNWYLWSGLRKHGYADVATELARRTVTMLATSGIREFYNPFTAEGQGAIDFGWTTLVLDIIHAEGWGCGCWMESSAR